MILAYLVALYLPLVISRMAVDAIYLKGDCVYYRAVIVSILEDGDMLLENNVDNPLNGQLALGKDGLAPKHPILMSLVSLPFYALFGDGGLLLFNLVNCMILAVLIFRINLLFHSRFIALITTLLYATTTLFYDYAYNYSPDIFSTVLFLGGLYLVLRERFYAGLAVLGVSLFAKLPNAPLVALVGLYVLLRIWRPEPGAAGPARPLARTLLAGAVFLAALTPLALANYTLFGSPFTTGYQVTAVAGATPGQAVAVNHTVKFNQPLVAGIANVLLHPFYGVLPSNLAVVLAFFGLAGIRSHARRVELYLIAALCLAQLLFFAKYDEWFTSHFSNRFMMNFVALSAVFSAFALARLGGRFAFSASNDPQ
ncbi:MAG TPA: hypothetical protein VD886_26820 [Herpetosiphonaceae bacterium]|nr:hypothetical protein [Herpetosiphonaceae bacterium]